MVDFLFVLFLEFIALWTMQDLQVNGWHRYTFITLQGFARPGKSWTWSPKNNLGKKTFGLKKNVGRNKIWVKILLTQKIFLVCKMFMVRKRSWVHKKFWVQSNLGPKKFWVQQNFMFKKISVLIDFGPKKILEKKFWIQKFWIQNCGSQKLWVQTNFEFEKISNSFSGSFVVLDFLSWPKTIHNTAKVCSFAKFSSSPVKFSPIWNETCIIITVKPPTPPHPTHPTPDKYIGAT